MMHTKIGLTMTLMLVVSTVACDDGGKDDTAGGSTVTETSGDDSGDPDPGTTTGGGDSSVGDTSVGETSAGDGGATSGSDTGEPTGGTDSAGGTDTGDTETAGAETGEPTTCDELIAAFEAEAAAIRSCEVDAECGQELTGTSCGCTRNWVARLDADSSEFYSLLEQMAAMECDYGLASPCDCPAADGYLCDAGTCTWNYI